MLTGHGPHCVKHVLVNLNSNAPLSPTTAKLYVKIRKTDLNFCVAGIPVSL